MGIVIDIYDPNETKFQRFKRNSKRRLNDAVNWCRDNPEIFGAGLAIATGLPGVAGKLIRKHAADKEKRLKDYYIYDRSLGRHIELKRRLGQRDLSEISRRKRDGERLSDILIDMRLVKTR